MTEDEEAEAQKRFHAAIGKLTKDLVDQGLLIEAGWMTFRAVAFPRDTPTAGLEQHKATFFAGALHLFSSIMAVDGIMEPGGEPTDNDEKRMLAINNELGRFGADFTRRYRAAQH
jgi:hypothetical protein